ncbi:uncharacterized protein ColSpa_08090 [Colletotrichum spaethianum]|uniref:Uncharacterized protein n=1 Tax=Colletotrichum spaethianum TaxID=700344 RepID=A0AA37UIE9_9PEZI|nr:uncharacterized protein ColSpa_08090 [Colletotrichum spaethianum]GKT47909.1 hypothetical protein ColSpa_08090 [Colletotrichum spaethianum]
MENTTIAPASPSTMSPTPTLPDSMSAALLAYKQKLVERIPNTVSVGYRNTLLDTIEAEVDVPSLDCKLRWTVEAAYHNNTEPKSHEVVALSLCFDSGALEDDSRRAQCDFYAKHLDLAHHMRHWSLRGLIDKHDAKVRAGGINATLVISGDGNAAGGSGSTHTDKALTAARRQKRPASAVEDLTPGPTGRHPDPMVDPSTVYHESKYTPRLNSLVKSSGAKPKRAVAPKGPVIPQAVLDRLPPSFMDPGIGGFAQLKQLRNLDAGEKRNTLPPSNRTDSLRNSVSIFGDPSGTAAAGWSSASPIPIHQGSPLPGGDSESQDTKEAAAAAIAAAAGSKTNDTPGDTAENPWVVAETAAETRLSSLAAQIAQHHRRARDKLQHAAALRNEHARMTERQPLEDGASPKDLAIYINESHGLAGRSLRYQEEAVAAVVEAGRLESERAEEMFERISRRIDRVQSVAVGTAGILKREKAAYAALAAQQVAHMNASKTQKEKRLQEQG